MQHNNLGRSVYSTDLLDQINIREERSASILTPFAYFLEQLILFGVKRKNNHAIHIAGKAQKQFKDFLQSVIKIGRCPQASL